MENYDLICFDRNKHGGSVAKIKGKWPKQIQKLNRTKNGDKRIWQSKD